VSTIFSGVSGELVTSSTMSEVDTPGDDNFSFGVDSGTGSTIAPSSFVTLSRLCWLANGVIYSLVLSQTRRSSNYESPQIESI